MEGGQIPIYLIEIPFSKSLYVVVNVGTNQYVVGNSLRNLLEDEDSILPSFLMDWRVNSTPLMMCSPSLESTGSTAPEASTSLTITPNCIN